MSTNTRDTEAETVSADDAGVRAAELEVLRTENQRLRAQFQQAKQTRYRRTILAFAAIGLIALAGGLLFPDVRVLLVTLGGTGLFGAILTYFLTPEQFHAATVSERLYESAASNAESVIDELGLQDHRVYVPAGADGSRLYVPSHREFSIPDTDALRSLFVVTDDDRERGAAFRPLGAGLYEDFETARTPADDLSTVAAQLSDGIVEQFELARGVDGTVDATAGEARFEISGSTCGPIDRFDHPVVSLLASGLAIHLDKPVTVEYPTETTDPTIRCVWETDRE